MVLPRPGRGAGTLIPSAQRFVWAARQPLGNQGSPVWQALSGHKRRIPLAVVLPRPGRGAVTLIPSAQRFVWVLVGRGVGGQSLQGTLETSPERWAETHPLQSLEGKTGLYVFSRKESIQTEPLLPRPSAIVQGQ